MAHRNRLAKEVTRKWGSMVDYRYVPILRAKQGEFRALGLLDSSTSDSVRPLLELEQPSDPGKKTPEEHYTAFAQAMAKAWGPSREFFVEDDGTPDSELLSGVHPYVALFNILRSESLNAIPVTGLTRTTAYGSAISTITATSKRLCIRLESDDFFASSTLSTRLDAVVLSAGLSKDQVDLVVDFGALPSNTGAMTLVAIGALTSIPDISTWRSLTVAMTSFPERPSAHVGTASTGRVPRDAWNVYQNLLASHLTRKPDFGDYAVDNPDTEFDIPPAILASTMTASIRYSTETDWLITRGNRLKTHGYDQYRDLSSQLMKETEYQGESFSWGDKYISDCASSAVGPGNQTTWRQVAVNHHITLVVAQLARLP